jgi:hypothetical protein
MKILTTLIFVFIFALSAANNAQAQASVLHDFSFTPDLVDTRDGAKSITFTANVSTINNVPGGLSEVVIIFNCGIDALPVYRLKEVSLNEKGEIYQGTVTFNVGNFNYACKVADLTMVDDFGGRTSLNFNQLTELGFKTSYQIIGTLGYSEASIKKRKRVRFF